jgi:hypothetical protein
VSVCGGPASATSCDVPGHVNHTAGRREYDLLLLGGTDWERVGPGLLLAAYCWHTVNIEQQALGVAAAATWLPMGWHVSPDCPTVAVCIPFGKSLQVDKRLLIVLQAAGTSKDKSRTPQLLRLKAGLKVWHNLCCCGRWQLLPFTATAGSNSCKAWVLSTLTQAVLVCSPAARKTGSEVTTPVCCGLQHGRRWTGTQCRGLCSGYSTCWRILCC